MTPDGPARWEDAVLAVELFAVDPFLLGGILLRAGVGPQRDQLVAQVRAALPASAPLLRIPIHITDDRLLGGLSLAATLRSGRVVAERGVLAQAHGGAVVVPMAERLEANVTAQLCGVLDRAAFSLERDGLTSTVPARLGVVAIDEGVGEERAPAPLADRLALHLDFSALDPRVIDPHTVDPARVLAARERLATVALGDEAAPALCHASTALGIGSLRAVLLASAVARAHAALEGRARVEEPDLVVAARLVLGPRATRVPPPAEQERAHDAPDDDPPTPETPPAPEPPEDPPREATPAPAPDLDELILAAAKSGLPAGLLELLKPGSAARDAPKTHGHAGALRTSLRGGRPAGARPGLPMAGERLNVVETLRAAAPWQPLRRRERAAHDPRRVDIRKEDFRLTRYKHRTETCVIFCVDASGSSALQRLAEAKGAVEQVLADCYVRRDQVALIAFRKLSATVVLPPTRSLVRVRRCLAELAGGGTTPLAAGIDAALLLALEAKKKGQTPVVVLMTDGRGNVPRVGREGRAAADEDVRSAARAMRASGVRTLFLDTSPRPRPPAAALAAELGARYLPLPYLDAVGISQQVQSLAGSP